MKKILFCFLMFPIAACVGQQKSFNVAVYGKGQPVILIPGYSGGSDVWKSTIDNLKLKYQLHVISLAGTAGIPPIDTPILKTTKNEIINYVKDNHLNKPVLIGNSPGGFLCLWMAGEEPGLFSKIICIDDLPIKLSMPGVLSTSNEIKNPAVYNTAVAARLINMPEKEFRDYLFKTTLNSVRDPAYAKLMAEEVAATDRKTLAYTIAEMTATDVRVFIANIDIPVLILTSNSGPKKMSEETSSEQYMLLRNKKILTPPVKHFILYDDPSWFREQVKNFLVNGLAD